MKKLKKLFLVVGIFAVLMVMSVVSVSASELDCFSEVQLGYSSQDTNYYEYVDISQNPQMSDCQILVYCFALSSPCEEHSSGSYFYFTEKFVEKNNDAFANSTDAETCWDKIVANETNKYLCFYGSGTAQEVIFSSHYIFVCDDSHLKLCFVAQFSEYFENKNLETQLQVKDTNITTLEGQVTELNTTITEKDSTITSLEGENTALNDEITSLEGDIEGLNTQVSVLTTRNTQLNATVKSLENQLQLKINKAYAEGLNNSDPKGNFVSVLLVIITVIEVGAVVAVIFSKIRSKRKHK